MLSLLSEGLVTSAVKSTSSVYVDKYEAQSLGSLPKISQLDNKLQWISVKWEYYWNLEVFNRLNHSNKPNCEFATTENWSFFLRFLKLIISLYKDVKWKTCKDSFVLATSRSFWYERLYQKDLLLFFLSMFMQSLSELFYPFVCKTEINSRSYKTDSPHLSVG